jgi:hypothetical protein
MVLLGRLAAWTAVWAGFSTAAAAGAAPVGVRAVTCTNRASGASWQIKIDYGKSTVNSDPARISDAQIAWRDATDGGNYTLDLKSGTLTVITASSTGGWLRYGHCALGGPD